jgi:hypothetical protein
MILTFIKKKIEILRTAPHTAGKFFFKSGPKNIPEAAHNYIIDHNHCQQDGYIVIHLPDRQSPLFTVV